MPPVAEVSRTKWLHAAAGALAVFAVLTAACSGREEAPQPEPSPTSTPSPTPPPNLPPAVTLLGPDVVHEGFEASWNGFAVDPEGGQSAVSIDFGVGLPVVVSVSASGSFSVSHLFAADGTRTVSVTAVDAAGNSAVASRHVEVIPRKVVFIGGVASESRCKGAMAPGWMRTQLAGTGLAKYSTIDAKDVLSFSYSGRYCDGGSGANGAYADYTSDHTCDGVDEAAVHLQRLVEAAAPSRVTVVGHSMGGLVAAYLAGEDPQWAREHVASIVAFDSPLQGVPRMNLEVLRLGGIGDGCSWNSPSLSDLGDGGNRVLDVAALAPAVVPVYTVDATEKDGPFGGIRQAVPGSRTRLDGEAASFQVGMGHSASWWNEAGDADGRRSQQLALVCGIAVLASTDCLAESW